MGRAKLVELEARPTAGKGFPAGSFPSAAGPGTGGLYRNVQAWGSSTGGDGSSPSPSRGGWAGSFRKSLIYRNRPTSSLAKAVGWFRRRPRNRFRTAVCTRRIHRERRQLSRFPRNEKLGSSHSFQGGTTEQPASDGNKRGEGKQPAAPMGGCRWDRVFRRLPPSFIRKCRRIGTTARK